MKKVEVYGPRDTEKHTIKDVMGVFTGEGPTRITQMIRGRETTVFLASRNANICITEEDD